MLLPLKLNASEDSTVICLAPSSCAEYILINSISLALICSGGILISRILGIPTSPNVSESIYYTLSRVDENLHIKTYVNSNNTGIQVPRART